METKLKILNRSRKGETIRKISRDMNLSRNTVSTVTTMLDTSSIRTIVS